MRPYGLSELALAADPHQQSALERIMREIRRRTRVVGAFPDSESALNLAAASALHADVRRGTVKLDRLRLCRDIFGAPSLLGT
jgi:transposase-like protein